jgi:ribosomal protein S18 acetylase RimI-like enzyme
VVAKAVEEARAAGAELIFLVTDADGHAQQLYTRLGFEAIGGYVKLRRAA